MKKLFVCLLFTAFLPIAASPVQVKLTNLTPFASTAIAGTTSMGSWCECGSSAACICDPGETPGGLSVDRNRKDQNGPSPRSTPEEGIDFGAVALMLVFFALTLSRLRG